MLGALYFSQGLPFGFQATALPVLLRERGGSLTAIGFAGALAAPWALKALWAPLVDRYDRGPLGRRRSWIVPMQALLAASCVAASVAVSAGPVLPLLALVLLMNLFAATQDIAVDGLAIDLLGPEDLGFANAGQVVGYKLGMLAGGGLLVFATRWIGWRGLFLTIAGLVTAVGVAVLFVREPRREEAGSPRAGARRLSEVLALLRTALFSPGTGMLLLVIGTYKLGEAMVDVMFKPFLVDAGFGAPQIGLWVGTYGVVCSLLGSAAGGVLASRRSLLGAFAIALGLRVVPLALQTAISLAPPTAGAVIAATCAEHFCGGLLTTCLFAFMMSRVDRRIGATHYTLLASVEVLGKSPAAWAAGPIAERFGYPALFALGTALSILFLALLVPLRRSSTP